MKKVAMFVTNPCTHDARVMKEAKTLAHNGFEVRVFALANAFNEPGVFKQDGYQVHRLKFANIFKRSQDVVWGVLGIVFTPLKMLVRCLRWLISGVIKVVKALVEALFITLSGLLSLPLLFLRYCFPAQYQRFFPSGAITSSGYLDTYDDRTTLQKIVLRLRRARVGVYLYLKSSDLKPRSRRRIILVLAYLLSPLVFLLKLTVKAKRLLVRSRSRLRRSYVLSRSFLIKKSNRLIYRILLPVHKISTYYFFCLNGYKAARNWGADIAHAHDLNTMYAAYLLKVKGDVKIVYDSHELWVHRNRVGRKATLEIMIDKIVERKLIRHADQVITVCDSIGQWLTDRYPGIPQPIILRNMPYRFVSADITEANTSLKQRLGVPESSMAMMYTGKITSGRGIEIGVAALSEVENLNLVLLGYGEESYVEQLKETILQAGVSDRVFFCPPVPYQEVTNFIAGADFALVYIEPICLSYEFALPNKLFESIQAGIPIMGSGLVEIRKVVEGLDVGLCFDHEKDLTDKLNSLQGDQLSIWRRNISEKKEQVCWEVEEQNLLDLYSHLVA